MSSNSPNSPQKKRPWWHFSIAILTTRVLTITLAWAIRPIPETFMGISCIGLGLLGVELYLPRKWKYAGPFISIFVANIVLFIGYMQG